MVENLLNEKRKKEEELHRAFEFFNERAAQLEKSHETLQGQVKQLSLDLEKTKTYLHNILESLTTGVVVVDQEEKITTFNKSAGLITGCQPTKCVGKNLKDIFPRELFEKTVSPLLRKGQHVQSLENVLFPKDKIRVDVRVSASPVWDGSGKQIGTALILQDITRLKRLEEEVQRNQRMKAMGEMAAGIAHEIRNPLGSIELFASLLKKDLRGDNEKEPMVDHICSGVKNMERIISSILLFAQSPEPSRQKCEISSLLNELLEFSSNIIVPESIKIIRRFPSGKLLANGDGDLLKQVFLNLIRNAIQAMPDGGELRLTAGENLETRKGSDKDRRRFITITVSDTGKGISPNNVVKVFDPFFTTRSRGTGLGLAITHNIVKAHQGTIEAQSREGEGASFIVNIPAWDG
ncbi:MAG: ATP-binding protein [Nitrospinota bacterium]|nr:ATP-binding protein [Nitrospinota bacterium]